MSLPLFLVIGVCAGILAGVFGVGGGLIIVPALVFLAGYSQVTATGTSLVAIMVPVGIAGVYTFWQAGQLNASNIKAGLLIALGMFLGNFLGAHIALLLPDYILKRTFAVFLLVVAARMWMATMSK